ncbi:probable tRNA N6-adenosine threonylcarbamoyltransferase, mitochondrial [Ctenocephalides felis]|uniref:probable tRNA N6-adenosine threonylcarbamoyltransferase, mitochondrial n=1 Tax=Ctenocephalides felis TaxID=7515 RepID=UPI000E6E4B2C|nr:probable tRNA N6-adenosine threonylcarbamoyltransferase, mitochondrial [Ctenocephalides felis]
MFTKYSYLTKLVRQTNVLKSNYQQAANSSNKALILGIETSCDDTGCAIVDTDGNILGEAVHCQEALHIKNGGIIPPLAQNEHRLHIENVFEKTLHQANISLQDINAIAVTNRPGLPLSLMVGVRFAKHLARQHRKPIIPVHHMEAHALTVRLGNREKIQFPFLVLLISGGHSLLAVFQDIDKILLLGDSYDDAPGEAFDKTARRLKLNNLKGFENLSGGKAIELAARGANNPFKYDFPFLLKHHNDCCFSFAGLKNTARRHIVSEERNLGVSPDGIIPDYKNFCASFQMAVARHLCHRTQRAMDFCRLKQLIPQDNAKLVVSGGVACNNFIYDALSLVCKEMDYEIFRPNPKLCTDNGIMIAWNGIEKYLRNIDIVYDIDSIQINHKSPLGESLLEDVGKENIKCKWVKIHKIYGEHHKLNPQ